MSCRASSSVLVSLACIFLAACGGGGNRRDSTLANVPNVGQLSGSYVFSATGSDPADGDYFVAGSLSFDGKGGVTGVQDSNLGSGVDSDVILTGTYQVSPVATVTVNLTDNSGDSSFIMFPLPSGTSSVKVQYNGNGGGTLQPQNTSGFSNAGNFAFTLMGEGEGTVAASGMFTNSSSGTITAGNEKYQDGPYSRTTSALSGGLSPAFDGGRGTAVIGSNLFSYYIVSSNQIVLAGLEDSTLVYGTATKQ